MIKISSVLHVSVRDWLVTSTVELVTVDPPRRGHSPSVITRTLLDPCTKKTSFSCIIVVSRTTIITP